MCDRFESFEQILDFAIDREINSRLYYLALAKRASSEPLIACLKRLADEELNHQKKLARVKQGQFKMLHGDMPVVDLGLAGDLPAKGPHPHMSLTEALQVAMAKEKLACQLYEELSQAAATEELSNLFKALANEEANHKVLLEIEYDDHLQRKLND